MSLYTEWRNLSDNHESQEAEVKFKYIINF